MSGVIRIPSDKEGIRNLLISPGHICFIEEHRNGSITLHTNGGTVEVKDITAREEILQAWTKFVNNYESK